MPRATQVGCKLEVTHQGQHGFSAAYSQSGTPRGRTGTEAEPDGYDCLVCKWRQKGRRERQHDRERRGSSLQGSEWWLCYFIHLLFATNAYWYESVKPLQYYCSCLPVSILLLMKKLLFWKKMLCSGNMILCRLAKCCNASIFALAAKFHLEPHVRTTLFALYYVY